MYDMTSPLSKPFSDTVKILTILSFFRKFLAGVCVPVSASGGGILVMKVINCIQRRTKTKKITWRGNLRYEIMSERIPCQMLVSPVIVRFHPVTLCCCSPLENGRDVSRGRETGNGRVSNTG